MIADRNIVSIFQGKSEAGPRALGNRSIVYDPRDHDGKEHVNIVKGREWFRPFAGSALAEDAHDWFDLAGMEESPYMMYAVNVAADKIKKIPAVCHVDDTCRVQTVTEEQNEHYYKLIKAFKDITGVPVLFNTSFNLAGDPLVETIDDALVTLYRSKLKYLYLPELGVLVTKTIVDPEPPKEKLIVETNADGIITSEN
jgi:carbamoyltransferase